MKEHRVQWLDVAKGLTIILMIIGHSSIPWYASNFIFAFHMPLFFIASGYCTNWFNLPFQVYSLRKLQSLGLPFVVYSLSVVALAYVIGYDSITFSGVITKGWEGYAMWFVPVLFIATLLSKAIMLLISRKWLRITICICLVLIGACLSFYRIYLPWSLSTVPYATFLVLLGSSLKEVSAYVDKPKWWLCLLCLIITIVISFNWRLDLAWNRILPALPLTIGAITGTMMMFMFSSYLTKIPCMSKILQAVGKETFVIMAFSQILGAFIQHFFSYNKVIEYCCMFFLLFVIVLLKNFINKAFGIKLL